MSNEAVGGSEKNCHCDCTTSESYVNAQKAWLQFFLGTVCKCKIERHFISRFLGKYVKFVNKFWI
jgi:hypothetical protein